MSILNLSDNLKKTPLYEEHLKLGARMVPFAGWHMPVQYNGVVPEHKAVRSHVGIFDVSHMGNINITGRGAYEFLQHMTLNDLSALQIGEAQYSAFCDGNGCVIDDIVVYKRGYDCYFLCVNASNIKKDMDWLCEHLPKQGVILEDLSEAYIQIALQGPRSLDVLLSSSDIQLKDLKYYTFAEGKLCGIPSLIARTGYTGELGYEFYVPAAAGRKIWNILLQHPLGVQPCGLGCRDTLRLEMGYLLYGQDMDETRTALECGLNWVTKWQKPQFIGREALFAQKEQGPLTKLVGFEMLDRAVARAHYPVFLTSASDIPCGLVTSGGPSPSLSKNIGMPYVPSQHAALGSEIWIGVRGDKKPARIVKKPFLSLENKK